MPELKRQHRVCVGCGSEAEIIASRPATADDIPALACVCGPVVHVHVLLCMRCGRPWVVLSADGSAWYGEGGSD